MDETAGARAAAAELADTVGKLNRKYRKDNKLAEDTPDRVILGTDMTKTVLVSTGNPALDKALGGGIPKGCTIEIYGAEGSGKSTTSAHVVKEVQKLGGAVIWYQLESSTPDKAFNIAGVDRAGLYMLDGRKSGEDGLDQISEIIMDPATNNLFPKKNIGLIVIDSIASGSAQSELAQEEKQGLAGSTIGTNARMWSKFFRVSSTQNWQRYGCIFLLVNQERTEINPQGPASKSTAGGMSVKYNSKIRIRMYCPKSKYIRTGTGVAEKVIGRVVDFTVTKNNISGNQDVHGEFRYTHGGGLDKITPVIEEACERGIIQEKSARYQIRLPDDNNILQNDDKPYGEEAMRRWAQDNPLKWQQVEKLCIAVRALIADKGYKNVNDFWVDDEGVVIDLAQEAINVNSPKRVPATAFVPSDSTQF